jgi:hypothetical protein
MVKEHMSGAAGVHRVDAAHPGPTLDPPAPSSGPIPVEQAPLDPRAIARASLDAARNVSLWWTSCGIVVALVVSLVVGTQAGVLVLAVVALSGAVVRAVLPSPGPVALSVRAKVLDVAVLAAFGLGLVLLSQLLPD